MSKKVLKLVLTNTGQKVCYTEKFHMRYLANFFERLITTNIENTITTITITQTTFMSKDWIKDTFTAHSLLLPKQVLVSYLD